MAEVLMEEKHLDVDDLMLNGQPTAAARQEGSRTHTPSVSLVEKDSPGHRERGLKGALRVFFAKCVESSLFSSVMMVCIVTNTVALAIDHSPQSHKLTNRIELMNYFLTGIFTLEMLLMLLAYGFRTYLSSFTNRFDALIVAASITEIAVNISGTKGGGKGRASVFRGFRAFRIFKLARRQKNFMMLLRIMYTTVLHLGNFALLFGLFVYIFALIGMEFFANKLHFDPATGLAIKFGQPGYNQATVPQLNFDTFL